MPASHWHAIRQANQRSVRRKRVCCDSSKSAWARVAVLTSIAPSGSPVVEQRAAEDRRLDGCGRGALEQRDDRAATGVVAGVAAGGSDPAAEAELAGGVVQQHLARRP